MTQRTSKEVIERWRTWNEEQKEKGKSPEPFFSRWLDKYFDEPCYTCNKSCLDRCSRKDA